MKTYRRNFRRRRTGFTKRGRRSWFANIIDASQPAATFAATDLITLADMRQNNLQTSASLLALYGHLAVGPGLAPGGAVNWAVFGIGVFDPTIGGAAGANDPDVAQNLTDERWLWTHRMIVPSTADGSLTFAIMVRQRVNLKDKIVRFVASNSDPAESFDYSLDARLLIGH